MLRNESLFSRILFEDAIGNSVPGENPKATVLHWFGNMSPLFLWMIIWTFTFFASTFQTLLCPVKARMVLKLFPPVAHIAIDSIFASLVIIIYVILELPIVAGNGFVIVSRRVSSIVLQVVSIYTESFVMFSKIEGAKLGFIVEHVEVFVKDIIMNELDSDLLFAMSKRKIISIFTLWNVIWIMGTKLCFVGLVLVQLLHSWVRINAIVPIGTLFSTIYVGTHGVGVELSEPFPILRIVVVDTMFMVMLFCIAAGFEFEVE